MARLFDLTRCASLRPDLNVSSGWCAPRVLTGLARLVHNRRSAAAGRDVSRCSLPMATALSEGVSSTLEPQRSFLAVVATASGNKTMRRSRRSRRGLRLPRLLDIGVWRTGHMFGFSERSP